MANEAVLIYETHLPVQMTVTNATGIEKGALLTLADLNTASAVTDSTAAFAGIAHSEKIASDGVTKLAVYDGGEFKVTASGAVTVGKAVVFENGGTVMEAGATSVFLAGYAKETAADGETFLMKLRPSHNLLA